MIVRLKTFISKNFFSPPKLVVKNKILNKLGFQILRIYYMILKFKTKKLFFSIKKKGSLENRINEEVHKKGYCIIEDFFKKSEFDLIKNTIELIKQENVLKKIKYGNVDVLVGELILSKKYNKDVKKIVELFNCSEAKLAIENILYSKIKSFQCPTYQEITLKENLIDEDDINSEFHPDRFYTCVKSFFYINNNSMENGAFEYYPESHKLNKERILYEYFHSIFVSSKNYSEEDLFNKEFVLTNGRITLTKKKLNELFGEPIICSAPENSFVISNNMGFHRRGKIQPNQVRKHLRNDYYDFQINPILRNTKNFIKNKIR